MIPLCAAYIFTRTGFNIGMGNEGKTKIVPLYVVARRLHIPASWLRAEVEAGRIPHLKAGKRAILLNPDVVEKLLVERASKWRQ